MQKKFVLKECRLVEGDGDECPVAWFSDPTPEEKKYLVDKLKIDEHTLASSLDPDELPRLEFEPDHVAVIMNWPRRFQGKDVFSLKVSTLGVFLFKERLVVVTLETDDPFSGKPFSKIKSLPHLLLKVVYEAINHFTSHLRAINAVSEELEQKINTSMENKYLLHMFSIEKGLTYYLSAIFTNGVLIERLKSSGAKIGFAQEELELLEDIHIENNQCYKQAEIYSNVLSSLMDARASIVSNNLNVLIKILNVITIGIMLPTLVVSIFSMNVKLPFGPENEYAFTFIISLAAASVISLLLIWRRMKL
jgi:magnesium transporter